MLFYFCCLMLYTNAYISNNLHRSIYIKNDNKQLDIFDKFELASKQGNKLMQKEYLNQIRKHLNSEKYKKNVIENRCQFFDGYGRQCENLIESKNIYNYCDIHRGMSYDMEY